jgi:hypothetical protein
MLDPRRASETRGENNLSASETSGGEEDQEDQKIKRGLANSFGVLPNTFLIF